MAFPQVSDADTQVGTVTTNSNSWTLTYPTNLASGDLILGFMGIDGDVTPTFPSGFVVSSGGDGTQTIVAAKKKSDGTESGTFSVGLTGSEQGCWRMLRIPAATWEGTLGTVWGQVDNSASVQLSAIVGLDPTLTDPNLWDVEDTLWIAVSAADHGNTTYTGFPSGFGNTSAQESGGANGAALGTARLESAVSSVNPSAFTIDTAEGAFSFVVAVRPAAPVVPHPFDNPIRRFVRARRMVMNRP